MNISLSGNTFTATVHATNMEGTEPQIQLHFLNVVKKYKKHKNQKFFSKFQKSVFFVQLIYFFRKNNKNFQTKKTNCEIITIALYFPNGLSRLLKPKKSRLADKRRPNARQRQV